MIYTLFIIFYNPPQNYYNHLEYASFLAKFCQNTRIFANFDIKTCYLLN